MVTALIAEVFLILLFVCTALCNRLNIAESERNNQFTFGSVILSSIRDHRKGRETKEVAYNCKYTSEHLSLIPTEVEIKCSLVYL